MSEPETNEALVAFEYPGFGSATEEFKQCDNHTGLDFIEYLDRIVAGRIDHTQLPRFAVYRSIPIYRRDRNGYILVFAVEMQNLDDRKVTVLFCGRIGVACAAGAIMWDGHDLIALRRHVIEARAAVWFR